MAHEDLSHLGDGAVLLDIGGDVGALIVHLPAEMAGLEIGIDAIPPRPGWQLGQHVAVIARSAGKQVQHTAVFPALRSGDYQLFCRPDGAVQLRGRVYGGHVTELRWPGM
jgi:hypothetical protein